MLVWALWLAVVSSYHIVRLLWALGLGVPLSRRFRIFHPVFRSRWVLGLTGPPQHYLGSQRQGLAPKRNHCERHRTKSETAANATGSYETTANHREPTNRPRPERGWLILGLGPILSLSGPFAVVSSGLSSPLLCFVLGSNSPYGPTGLSNPRIFAGSCRIFQDFVRRATWPDPPENPE